MEEIIRLNYCWNKIEQGYVSTFATINLATKEVVSLSFTFNKKMFSSEKSIHFDSFEKLQNYLEKQNESELNSFEVENC